MKYSKIFAALVVVPQIVATVTALVETVKSVETDPALSEALKALRQTVGAAEWYAKIRVQLAVLKSLIKQLS